MDATQLRRLIDDLSQDIDFTYKGVDGSICPFSRDNISLCYDGQEVTVNSVDKAMSTPFIHGKSLNEVCDELTI